MVGKLLNFGLHKQLRLGNFFNLDYANHGGREISSIWTTQTTVVGKFLQFGLHKPWRLRNFFNLDNTNHSGRDIAFFLDNANNGG